MKHSKSQKITASLLLKYTFFSSAALLLLSALILLLTDVSFRAHPQILSYSTATNLPATAEYYPADPAQTTNPKVAFLLTATKDATTEKTLLSLLLQSAAPVLVTHHSEGQPKERQTLETEAALLCEKSGIPETDLVLIGLHHGGSVLLDEILHGTHSYRAMALVAPILGEGRIDEGTIVSGKYHNENAWINSLNPSMLRQPTLLLSSNGDDISTAYGMTLLYNKLSGDEIIHMGGVYRASHNHLSLSILDGGFHPNSPYHKTILTELLEFVQLQTGVPLSYGSLPTMRYVARIGLALGLLVLLFCVSKLTRYRLTDVSYGIASAIKLEDPKRFFLSKAAAWLLCLPLGSLLIWSVEKLHGAALSLPSMFSLILFTVSLLSIWLSHLMKQPGLCFFKSVGGKPLKLLMGLLYAGAATAVLMLIPFSGYTFHLPDQHRLFILVGLSFLSFLWFRLFLGESEQIEDYKAPIGIKLSYYLIVSLPLIFFALLYSIFCGNTAALSCVIVLALLLENSLLAKGIFHLCGSASVAAFLGSFAFQASSMILATF